MAHKINYSNGRYAFASAKEKAWHGLGIVLPDLMTSEEAIKYGGLDFEVGLAELYAKYPVDIAEKLDEKGSKLPINYATYRQDTGVPFGVVGQRYHVVQNKEAFTFFDSIIAEGDAIYETVGALGNGETIFITAKLPEYISVKGDDIEKYLLLTMAHDGSSSIQAMFTPIRVVCNNTLRLALGSTTNKVTIRHTKNASNKLKEAHKIMGITNKLVDEVSVIFEQMANTPIKQSTLTNFVHDVFLDVKEKELVKLYGTLNAEDINGNQIVSTRKQNIINDVFAYHESGVGQDTIASRGTVFGMYNAITGYYQNVKDYSSDEAKFSNILQTGSATKIMETSFNHCLHLLN